MNKKIVVVIILLILSSLAYFSINKYTKQVYLNKIEVITDMELIQDVEDSIIYFSRPTCPTCKKLNLIINNLDIPNDKKIYYFNTDEYRESIYFKDILKKYNVTSVPYIVKVKDTKISEVLSVDSEDVEDSEVVRDKLKKFFDIH